MRVFWWCLLIVNVIFLSLAILQLSLICILFSGASFVLCIYALLKGEY